MSKIYLSEFYLPSADAEENFFFNFPLTCYDIFYPFRTLSKNYRHLELFPLTILYGGNGCGKTTILNVIAEKLGIKHNTKFNKTDFMKAFLKLSHYEMAHNPSVSKIITSDDVFSSIFLTREKNEIVDKDREDSFAFRSMCNSSNRILSDIMDELCDDRDWLKHSDTLSKILSARRHSASQFARETVGRNIRGKSNGESALDYFYTNLQEPGLYLLDEPENSLSATYQKELAHYLYNSVRFFDAQLIIATHSPFMLSIPGAMIYNLDSEEFCITDDWTKLENMKNYYELFKQYSAKFEND